MWHDHDKIIEIYNKLSQGDARFPCECPNCKHKTTHIYIHAHNRDHCGIWIWCSECGAYAHMSGHTPTWWENPIFVDSYNLCSEPDYLETKTTEIDEWVNSLIPHQKSCSRQALVIEDRYRVKLKTDIQGVLAGSEGILVVKNNLETTAVQFICDGGEVIDLLLSNEELLQAVEVL